MPGGDAGAQTLQAARSGWPVSSGVAQRDEDLATKIQLRRQGKAAHPRAVPGADTEGSVCSSGHPDGAGHLHAPQFSASTNADIAREVEWNMLGLPSPLSKLAKGPERCQSLRLVVHGAGP